MKKNEPNIKLKYPIELSTSPRDWDGSLLALANTVDGGESVVVWKNSSWVLTDAVDVSKVLSLPEAAESDLTEVDIKNTVPSSMDASEHQLNLLKKLSSKELNEAIDRGIDNAEEQAIQKLKHKKDQNKRPKQKLIYLIYENLFSFIYNFSKKNWKWILGIIAIIYFIYSYYIDYAVSLILGTIAFWLYGIAFLAGTIASLYTIYEVGVNWNDHEDESFLNKLTQFIGPILGTIFCLFMNYVFIMGLINDGPFMFLM